MFLKIAHFFTSLNGKQAAITQFVLTVAYLNTVYNSSIFSARFTCLNTFFVIFEHSWAMKRSWKFCHGVLGKS